MALDGHLERLRYAEGLIAFLFCAIVVFIATADSRRDCCCHRSFGETEIVNYSPLDPADTAILFADLQEGIIELTATNELPRLRRAIGGLAKFAKLFGLPVVVTTAPGGADLPRVTQEISASLGEQPQYVRTTTDAFLHPATRAAILNTKCSVLLIAGVATEIIVQHSALSALKDGIKPQVVVDACGGMSARTEDAALRRLTQEGVALTSTLSVIGQLAGDLSTPKGSQAISILYEMAKG